MVPACRCTVVQESQELSKFVEAALKLSQRHKIFETNQDRNAPCLSLLAKTLIGIMELSHSPSELQPIIPWLSAKPQSVLAKQDPFFCDYVYFEARNFVISKKLNSLFKKAGKPPRSIFSTKFKEMAPAGADNLFRQYVKLASHCASVPKLDHKELLIKSKTPVLYFTGSNFHLLTPSKDLSTEGVLETILYLRFNRVFTADKDSIDFSGLVAALSNSSKLKMAKDKAEALDVRIRRINWQAVQKHLIEDAYNLSKIMPQGLVKSKIEDLLDPGEPGFIPM